MDKSLRNRWLLAVGMVVSGVLLRFIPHPPNFAPITALALFAGAHFQKKSMSFAIPLATMLITDSIIHVFTGQGFHALTFVVYGSFAAIVCIGFWVRNHIAVPRLIAASLMGSVLFYVVTNFGNWALLDFYPHTSAGLIACYVAGIPFFGNAIVGDLFYTGVFFGVYALAERRIAAPLLKHS